jgi:hypothetical protein
MKIDGRIPDLPIDPVLANETPEQFIFLDRLVDNKIIQKYDKCEGWDLNPGTTKDKALNLAPLTKLDYPRNYDKFKFK